MNTRLIAHVDMDAFYASVEQHDRPELKGRPVIVGGTSRRGVVCAASYEARPFGVRSAMPMYEARRCCPDAVYLPVRMPRYQQVSAQIFACFSEFTPQIEGLSLDEAFLDLSDTRGCADPPALGRDIKQAIRARTGLAASVGLGPNKLIAKIASEKSKPDGLLHVPIEDVQTLLDPLPVTALWGIGPRTGTHLETAGIRTVAELRRTPQPLLQALFGNQAHFFRQLACGEDPRSVGGDAQERSVSQETTFERDLADFQSLAGELRPLTESLCAILRRQQLRPHTLVLKLRTTDFKRHTRQRRFAPPDNSFNVLWPLAQELLREWLAQYPRRALRLIGVGARDFAAADQLGLFEESLQRAQRLDAAADAVRARFGASALARGLRSPPE
ncbi:MAG TPA: DNA polymerase IV [Gammaproteobacteria bacterium]|nr:DNA polymerase IV [Gammaproteobacteria bacterium]